MGTLTKLTKAESKLFNLEGTIDAEATVTVIPENSIIRGYRKLLREVNQKVGYLAQIRGIYF